MKATSGNPKISLPSLVLGFLLGRNHFQDPEEECNEAALDTPRPTPSGWTRVSGGGWKNAYTQKLRPAHLPPVHRVEDPKKTSAEFAARDRRWVSWWWDHALATLIF